jgi:hypothetical protein
VSLIKALTGKLSCAKVGTEWSYHKYTPAVFRAFNRGDITHSMNRHSPDGLWDYHEYSPHALRATLGRRAVKITRRIPDHPRYGMLPIFVGTEFVQDG